MKITHIRNATMLVTLGEHHILVDPMLSEPAALPGFRLVGGRRRRNPLVPLPEGAIKIMEQATAVLVTHEHPDHLDKPAVQWIKSRSLPVWASSIDAPSLARKGLRAQAIPQADVNIPLEVVPGRHGHGLIGWLMGPVSGFYFACRGEPSLYLTSDTVMSAAVRGAIDRLAPSVIVAPAGAANFGFGKDLLFSIEELILLARMAPGRIVFNHLEALDHCPASREQLRQTLDAEGIGERASIPLDGEALEFDLAAGEHMAPPGTSPQHTPGLQKWLTAKFAGT